MKTTIEPKVLFIEEVANEFRVHISSIRRWLAETRAGRGNLVPLPISRRGAKLRWLASDVKVFLAAQSSQPPPNITTVRQTKREEREFLLRQREAQKKLDLLRNNRKSKKTESR